MKPTQLATLLNISPATLRLWSSGDFGKFLSPSAQGANGARRSYSDSDARIVAWIADLKAQNMLTADILGILHKAQADDWRDLPPLRGIVSDQPIPVVPREAVEERVHGLQQRYELVVRERDQLKADLERQQHESADTLDQLQQRVIDLTREAAELRGLLAQYSFSGRRFNAATLIVIALLGGALFSLLVLVIGILLSSRV